MDFLTISLEEFVEWCEDHNVEVSNWDELLDVLATFAAEKIPEE